MIIKKGSKNKVGSYNLGSFDCNCDKCSETIINEKLIDLLDEFNSEYKELFPSKVDLIILSGYRCKSHNTDVGGVYNSYHTMGDACDFFIGKFYQSNGIFLPVVYDIIPALKSIFPGVGFYPKRGFIHVDVGDRRFWEK